MSGIVPAKIVRVVIVDDSPIIRLGLRSALEDYPDIAIVAEAGNAAEGVAAVARHKPDVVLLDLNLPDRPGIQACREIVKARAQTNVLILTSNSNERNVQEAMLAGAKGYLLKDNDGATLAAALRALAAGSPVLDPVLAGQVISLVKQRGAASPAEKLNLLSHQERRVVALLSQGLTNKEIGDQLGLTEKTVKNYLATIFSKLNISRRAHAAALYVEAVSSGTPE